jgi:hypothetical protein
MNIVVSIKYKGKSYYAGLIEPDDEKGFYNWSLYWTDGGGLATSKREARKFIMDEAREEIKNGAYFQL